MKKENTSIRLKKIMNERGLKQVDILEMAKPYCIKYHVKLNKNDLSQYVSGKVEPGQNKLSILGLTLNVSEAWLMGYDVPIARQPLDKSFSEHGQPNERDCINNIIKIAGRDGSYVERKLTDDQLDLIKRMIEQMPDADDL